MAENASLLQLFSHPGLRKGPSLAGRGGTVDSTGPSESRTYRADRHNVHRPERIYARWLHGRSGTSPAS
jgi:hypothetical protein